jgi:hypothetical protein
MEVTYHQFLNIRANHAYYKNGVSAVFNLVPFELTSRQMQNYSILLNSNANSFSLFSGVNSDESFDIETQFSGIDDIYFQLVVSDPYFFNYTALQISSAGPQFLLSNKDKPSDSAQLHDNEFVSASEAIQIRPPQSNYVIPDGDVKLEVKNSDGEVVIKNEQSNPQQTNFLLDLRNEESGVYELWLNNEIKEQFFLTEQSLQPGCIGIVHLDMATLIDNFTNEMAYHINFDSRSVYWRYKIVVPTNRQLLEVNIWGWDLNLTQNWGRKILCTIRRRLSILVIDQLHCDRNMRIVPH